MDWEQINWLCNGLGPKISCGWWKFCCLNSEVHSSLSSHFWFLKWGLPSISSQCGSLWSELICHISISFTTLSFGLTLFGLPLNAGFEFDYIFDWTIIKYQQSQRTKAQPRVSVSNLLTTIYWELASMKLAFIWFYFPWLLELKLHEEY